MTDLPIVTLGPEDLDSIVEVEIASFAHPWSRAMFEAEFINSFSHLCGIRMDGRLVAYIDYWIILDEAHIMSVGVVPEHRRKGLATRLLSYMVAHARSEGVRTIFLEVRVGNEDARALYERFGFVYLGVRKGYYENGEDALVMSLSLGGEGND